MSFLDLFRPKRHDDRRQGISGTQPGQEQEILRNRGMPTVGTTPVQHRKSRRTTATRPQRLQGQRTHRAKRPQAARKTVRKVARKAARKTSRKASRKTAKRAR